MSVKNATIYSSKFWKQKIQVDLQGDDYNKTLLTNTNENIVITPFYHFDSFEKLNTSTSNIQSTSCKKIEIINESIANQTAVKSLKKGFKSVFFIAHSVFDYTALFHNLLQKNITFHFCFSFLSERFLKDLQVFLHSEKVFFNLDILGHLAKTGNWYDNYKTDFKALNNMVLPQKDNHTVLSVYANNYQNAGANTVQQIAYALAQGNEYIIALKENIPSGICFHFAVGSNYFFEIAKLNAFRYLWDIILGEYNITTNTFVSVEKTKRNNAQCSQFNVFRKEMVFEIANIGKANFIFESEEKTRKSTSFFTDSSLSFYIETLTKQMAENAFEIFKNIEKGGGFLQQLKKGNIQRKIQENAQKEQLKIDEQKEKFKNIYNKKNAELKPTIAQNPVKTLFPPIISKPLI